MRVLRFGPPEKPCYKAVLPEEPLPRLAEVKHRTSHTCCLPGHRQYTEAARCGAELLERWAVAEWSAHIDGSALPSEFEGRCPKCGVMLSPEGHHLYATDCALIDGTGGEA